MLYTPAAEPPSIDRDSSAGELFHTAILAAAARLTPDDDPEGVHQTRVAVRRIRSSLRTFAPILDPAWAGALDERIRPLGDRLAAARDADVLLERLQKQARSLPAGDYRPKELVLDLLRVMRDAAYRQLRAMLHEHRYVRLRDEVLAAAGTPRFGARASEPAAGLVTELMEQSWRELCLEVRGRSRPATDGELHRIRIRAKRVRYAAEAVSPVTGAAALTFAARVARLQHILGEQRDATISCEQLRRHIHGGDGAFVASELTALESAAARAARRRWRDAWRAAREPDVRFWRR